MSSGLLWTIVKPNGLGDGPAGAKKIVVAHDDLGWNPMDPNFEFIARADVARILAYAAANPKATAGIRFDVTSMAKGVEPPTENIASVFERARLPWDPRNHE